MIKIVGQEYGKLLMTPPQLLTEKNLENNLQQEAESFLFPNHFANFNICVSIHQVAPHFPPPYPFPTHPYNMGPLPITHGIYLTLVTHLFSSRFQLAPC